MTTTATIGSAAFVHAERIANARAGSWLLTCDPIEVVLAHEGGSCRLVVGTRVKVTCSAGPVIFGNADTGRGILPVVIQYRNFGALELEGAAAAPAPSPRPPSVMRFCLRHATSVAIAVCAFELFRYAGASDLIAGFIAGSIWINAMMAIP